MSWGDKIPLLRLRLLQKIIMLVVSWEGNKEESDWLIELSKWHWRRRGIRIFNYMGHRIHFCSFHFCCDFFSFRIQGTHMSLPSLLDSEHLQVLIMPIWCVVADVGLQCTWRSVRIFTSCTLKELFVSFIWVLDILFYEERNCFHFE